MIITIDGPASAGKGTLASFLASCYRLAYFDTGMVYRAVGLEMFLRGLNVEDEAAAAEIATKLTFQRMMELSTHPEFRGPRGGQNASIISAYPEVRRLLLKMQQDFCKNPTFPDGSPAEGAVYDGRDTGTVVCPGADVKLFVTASPEVRAERRYKEFLSRGIQISYDEVLKDIKARDERDSTRSAAPLRPAEDAVVLDTSSLSIEEVEQKACAIIDSRLVSLENLKKSV